MSDGDVISLLRGIDTADIGKIIGKGGAQSSFIKRQSGLEVFSVNDGQEFVNWGRTWCNIYMRGTVKSIQTALVLIESTLKSYSDRQLKTTREQLEEALSRIQELEEKLM